MRWRWFVNAMVHLRFADCCEQQTDSFHASGLFPMATALVLGETDAPAERNPVANLLLQQKHSSDASVSTVHHRNHPSQQQQQQQQQRQRQYDDDGVQSALSFADEGSFVMAGGGGLDGGEVVFLENDDQQQQPQQQQERQDGQEVGDYTQEGGEDEQQQQRQRLGRPGDRPTRRATLFGSVIGIYRSSTQEGMVTLTHCLGDDVSDVTQALRVKKGRTLHRYSRKKKKRSNEAQEAAATKNGGNDEKEDDEVDDYLDVEDLTLRPVGWLEGMATTNEDGAGGAGAGAGAGGASALTKLKFGAKMAAMKATEGAGGKSGKMAAMVGAFGFGGATGGAGGSGSGNGGGGGLLEALQVAARNRKRLAMEVRSTNKACNSSTMTILAPIALLGRECCAYYLFSSHGNLHCSQHSYLFSGILKQFFINESREEAEAEAPHPRRRSRRWTKCTRNTARPKPARKEVERRPPPPTRRT